MAVIVAKRDTEKGYIYVASGDGFVIPEGCRFVLKRHGGEFNGTTHEWRVPVEAGPAVVAAFRTAGHQVITKEAGAKPERPRLQECALCAAPHRPATLPPTKCSACGEDLELVPAHVCGDDCTHLRGAR